MKERKKKKKPCPVYYSGAEGEGKPDASSALELKTLASRGQISLQTTDRSGEQRLSWSGERELSECMGTRPCHSGPTHSFAIAPDQFKFKYIYIF